MKIKGPWTNDQARFFLDESTIPLRIACQGASGYPLIASLWYLREGETLWCATQRGSGLAARLSKDGKCAFEVSVDAAPYRGVRGSALATLHPNRGEEVLRGLIRRYHGSTGSTFARLLLDKVESEVAIALHARNLTSWDFNKRMKTEA